MQTYKISLADTQSFARVWTRNGIAILMQDVHMEFATDFANLVLANFIEMCQKDAAAAQRKREAEAAPRVVLA